MVTIQARVSGMTVAARQDNYPPLALRSYLAKWVAKSSCKEEILILLRVLCCCAVTLILTRQIGYQESCGIPRQRVLETRC
jgi:hypothetical protein